MGLFNFTKTLAGPGFIILNVIRAMNIISLLLVIAASSVMLIKTFIVSKFFFFDAVTHVVEAWISIFLILTETPLFKTYFTKNWPLFSPNSGFLALGLSMMCLGNGVLGFLNKSSTSQKSLGLTFWRIVISAGILAFTMGIINIFANYIFRDRANGITARQVRSYGAVASHHSSPSILENGGAGGFPHRDTGLSRKGSLPSYYAASSSSSSSSAGPDKPSTTTTVTTTNVSAAVAAAEMRQAPPPRLPFTISRPIAIQKSGDSQNPAGASPPASDVGSSASSGTAIAAPDLAHHPALYPQRI